MPANKPTPEGTPSDDLLLAALDRAERHQCREGQGVLLVTLKAHLGLPHHSGTTLRLRPQLARLQTAGLIERTRHLRLILWRLTGSGHARLDDARLTDELALPESPQHQQWATAQLMAGQRIADLRADMRQTLDEAMAMLDDPATSSDAWFALVHRLKDACWRLAAATHILNEWAEPNDAHPDIDTHPQRGRRNIQAWAR
jgi:DNA-binding transcriptional regulator PaaX